MNIKDFKSGTLRQEYQYKSFIPEMINHTFTWDDPQINTMLEDATRALGELNAFTMIVPNVDIFIQMHITKEANTSRWKFYKPSSWFCYIFCCCLFGNQTVFEVFREIYICSFWDL